MEADPTLHTPNYEIRRVRADHLQQDDNPEQRGQAEPRHAALTERHDHGRCQQRPQRRSRPPICALSCMAPSPPAFR